jgi:hypothetical protein
MKFEKPFHIKIQPYYDINEPTTDEENIERDLSTYELGGLTSIDERPDGENVKIFRSGGRMDWNLFRETNGHKPETNIHLMRLWALQLATQMINEKAFVNEIHSEPKFEIPEEDKEIMLKTIQKMNCVINDELEKSAESMVTNKKLKKVEL